MRVKSMSTFLLIQLEIFCLVFHLVELENIQTLSDNAPYRSCKESSPIKLEPGIKI